MKRCNIAEAEFWKQSEGYQIRPSDELLQFDCGGQVGLSEVAKKSVASKIIGVSFSKTYFPFLCSNGSTKSASLQGLKTAITIMICNL